MNKKIIYYIVKEGDNYLIKNCSKYCNKTKTGKYRFYSIGQAYVKIKELTK